MSQVTINGQGKSNRLEGWHYIPLIGAVLCLSYKICIAFASYDIKNRMIMECCEIRLIISIMTLSLIRFLNVIKEKHGVFAMSLKHADAETKIFCIKLGQYYNYRCLAS